MGPQLRRPYSLFVHVASPLRGYTGRDYFYKEYRLGCFWGVSTCPIGEVSTMRRVVGYAGSGGK
jgi:hypothetical protein